MKSQEAARVLVVEHDRDLGAMFVTVLAMEGYWAEWRPYHSDVAAEARELSADLLVIGLPPVGSAYSLLDSLRSDEQARAIPVLAVTTVEQVAEGANASFNVKSTLVMPFDLEDFLSQVRRALRQPAFQKQQPGGYRPAGILDLAQQILSTRSRDTLFRWVQRLRTETALSERDDLRFSEVLDDVPILIEVLTAAFDYASPEKAFEENPQAADRVCTHATTRHEQGVPLELLIREYALLREEIWRTFWRELPERLERDDIARLNSFVDGTLDLIIQQTIPTYLGDQVQASEG